MYLSSGDLLSDSIYISLEIERKYLFEAVDFDVIGGCRAVKSNARTDGGYNAH